MEFNEYLMEDALSVIIDYKCLYCQVGTQTAGQR